MTKSAFLKFFRDNCFFMEITSKSMRCTLITLHKRRLKWTFLNYSNYLIRISIWHNININCNSFFILHKMNKKRSTYPTRVAQRSILFISKIAFLFDNSRSPGKIIANILFENIASRFCDSLFARVCHKNCIAYAVFIRCMHRYRC